MPRRELVSFLRGYATDLPPERMRPDMLLVATNLYPDKNLIKRRGVVQNDTLSGSPTVRGFRRVYLAGKWRNLYAVDDGTEVQFHITTTDDSTQAEIDPDISWKTGYDVEFAEQDGKIVAVNGYDKPLVIWVEDLLLRGDCESTIQPLVDKDSTTQSLANATFARSSARAYQGSYSYRHTKTSAAGAGDSNANLIDGGSFTDLHGIASAKLGTLIALVGRVYIPSSGGPAASEVTLRWSASTNGSSFGTNSSATATTQDTWERLSVYVQLTTTTTGILPRVRIATTAEQNELVDWDDLHLWRFVVETMDAHDPRARDTTVWGAGQYDASGTGDTLWVDDTTDAQDAGADDFEIGNTTNGDGCYIACDLIFTKVVFVSATQAASTPTTVYEYYNGTAWVGLSLITTPSWDAAAADRTLEFDLPLDWVPYDLDENYVKDRFVIRIRHTTAASGAFSCDYLTVTHTQVMTQILSDLRPHLVYAHNNRIFLAAGIYLFVSPYNSILNWVAEDIEYFSEAGSSQITAMVTLQDFLCVFTENTIHGFFGDSHLNWVKQPLVQGRGTRWPRSVVVVKGVVFFVSEDALCMFNGEQAVPISNHCKTDFDAFTLTGAVACNWKDRLWVSFPSDSTIWWTDPESISQDEREEWQVGLFKLTGFRVDIFSPHVGAGDDDLLLAADNGATKQILQLERTDQEYDLTATAITATWQTAYIIDKGYLQDKVYRKARVKVSRDGNYTYTVLANEADANITGTIASGSGATPYVEELGLPADVDGRNLSFKLVHATTASCTIYGVAYDYERDGF